MDEHDDTEEPRKSQRRGRDRVRIIGPEEAAAALEAGQATGRRPDDALRYGDVPPPPEGPRPPHRFPLPDSVDPAEAVPRPPLAPEESRWPADQEVGEEGDEGWAAPPETTAVNPVLDPGLDPAGGAAPGRPGHEGAGTDGEPGELGHEGAPDGEGRPDGEGAPAGEGFPGFDAPWGGGGPDEPRPGRRRRGGRGWFGRSGRQPGASLGAGDEAGGDQA
ncbi:MAG: hypothetical protein ACRD0J_03590, partial [Acidimicrobiales bacterium]